MREKSKNSAKLPHQEATERSYFQDRGAFYANHVQLFWLASFERESVDKFT
jgi:hypothetical protein